MKLFYFSKLDKEILELESDLSERVHQSIRLLEQKAHMLGMPDSKPLGKGLFELRIVGREHVRIFY